LIGLGLVALLVAGVGIANVLLIGVLERRVEIGLRRALGATPRHVAVQFLVEALTLGAAGGAVGCIAGFAITVAFSSINGWLVDLPLLAVAGGIAAAILTSAVAGVYPALRAAALAPMEALRSS
jgi:putative ABC transport system permease protein